MVASGWFSSSIVIFISSDPAALPVIVLVMPSWGRISPDNDIFRMSLISGFVAIPNWFIAWSPGGFIAGRSIARI
jgi:hypothetical protein